MLKELLNHVIAEYILGELQGVGEDLVEEVILFVAVGAHHSVLNEARSILVATEFHDMVIYILCRTLVMTLERV